MDIINVPRPEVLKAGIAHAELDPKHWNQSSWVDVPYDFWDESAEKIGEVCGTTACLAGHILLASGDFTWKNLLEMQKTDRDAIADKAMELLGYEKGVDHSCNCEYCDVNVEEEWKGDGEDFQEGIFHLTHDYAYGNSIGTNGQLAKSEEAFAIFKAKVSELTGVEL